MARKSKAEKALDNAYDAAFKRLGNGVQFDMFDLSKVRADSIAAVQAGANMEDAVAAAVAKYRKN